MRGENFNMSFFFWIWLIWVFILGLKINTISGFSFERETEAGRLKIPAFGRSAYGIGSLYDGRTGNFLPPEFSVISEKSRLRLNPKVVNRTKPSKYSRIIEYHLSTPSTKLNFVFEEPRSGYYDYTMGPIIEKNFDGLALRAVLGMLEFPENAAAGFLLDNVTQQEMTELITNYVASYFSSFEDELIFPETGDGINQSPQGKLLQREIRRNMKRVDIKILKKATHVVVKVIRGSNWIERSTASSFRILSDDPAHSADLNSDSILSATFQNTDEYFAIWRKDGVIVLSPSTPGGIPLSFELMPLLPFLNKTGLKLTPSSQQKFIALEDSNWRNPMEIRHGRTFYNLDWSWQLLRQITKLNSTFHQCLQENPRKDVKRGGEMIQELQHLYQNLTEKLTTYKRDLKSLLEKSSTGTEQDAKLWNSIYLKPNRAAGTGIHWDFYRLLDPAQRRVFILGGENNNEIYPFEIFYRIVNATEDTVKLGCDAIPEMANSF